MDPEPEAACIYAGGLHDTGRSDWWLLLAFVPLPGLIPIIFFVLDSESSDDQWGPPPLGSRYFRGQVQG